MVGVRSYTRRPPREGAVPRAGLFLDRDGVIVEDCGYLHRPCDIRYIPGALQAIAHINEAGVPVVLVTNQAGIGKGYYGWADFESVQLQIERDLAALGGWFDGVWACAHHPEGIGELAQPDSVYRKPNPEMLLDAASRLAIDLSSSWLVGDKPCDVEAAFRSRLRGAIHVLTGHGAATREEVVRLAQSWPAGDLLLGFATELSGAIESLLGRMSARR